MEEMIDRTPMSSVPSAVYVHVPFCRAKCAYCDFNSYAGKDGLHEAYAGALRQEAERFWRDRPPAADAITSVYIGGGTPTVLPADQLGRILSASAPTMLRTAECEVTVEANPGTVDAESLGTLRRVGFNRLSLGVQSLDDGALKSLGRVHDAAEARRAVALARAAGFDNVNLDLIYGLPWQSLASWRWTLREALRLDPEHLSLYALSVEPGTPLHDWVERGEIELPGEDQVADMYSLAEDILRDSGYEHYEISNWARPGRECRHNLVYWANEPYVGFGAGAHSYVDGRRRGNVADPAEYVRRASDRLEVVESDEAIGSDLEMAETLFLGLRRGVGVSHFEFRRRFGRDLADRYGLTVAELVRSGLLSADADGIRLTPRGRLLGNEVFVRFLPGAPTTSG